MVRTDKMREVPQVQFLDWWSMASVSHLVSNVDVFLLAKNQNTRKLHLARNST